jgi:hypothetical protein
MHNSTDFDNFVYLNLSVLEATLGEKLSPMLKEV